MPSPLKKIRSSVRSFFTTHSKPLSFVKSVYHSVNRVSTRKTKRSDMVAWLRQMAPLSCEKPLIRLGPNRDGGYLVPDELDGIEACFSPGVSLVSGFEASCAERGMKVFMADKSVAGPAEDHELFTFTPTFIGATSGGDFITLDQWVENSLPATESDLLLQMDIEGCEYEVLLSTSDELMNRFRIIVIEFHLLDQFWSLPFYKVAKRACDKLMQTHACVHIHPNNCSGSTKKRGLKIPPVMEFTFVRRDYVKSSPNKRTFPHPLDVKNVPEKRDIVLPKCWYKI